MKKELLFYIPAEEGGEGVAGPYDIVQMAGLLRRGQINSERPVFQEGDAEWKAFADRPQFIVAREMPADAVSHRKIALDEEASAGKGPIPLPSKEKLVEIGFSLLGLLIVCAIVFVVARLDAPTGMCIFVLAGATVLITQILIVCRMLDEDPLTLLLIAVIPFYDLFYFTSNFDKYLKLFAVKYCGSAIATAAFVGLASVASQQSDDVKGFLHMIGL